MRIPSRVITLGGTIMGLVLTLMAIVGVASSGRRIVLVDTRPIQSVTTPFNFESDRRRFMMLVVMPVCPGNQEASGAVALSCTVTADGVRVELRRGLLAGKDGTEVHAEDLIEGLEKYLEGYAVAAEGNALSVVRKPKQLEQPMVPPSVLVSLLRDEPAVVASLGEQLSPVGTGPFYVHELWCHADDKSRKVPCSRAGGTPPVRLGELDEWLEDVVVLRRRDWSGRTTTEIVVVGLQGKDNVSAKPPRAEALARALTRGDVNGVFDVESDLEDELRTASKGHTEGWRFSEPRQDRVLVAALRPPDPSGEDEQLPPHCRARLVHALAKIRQDPTFWRHLGAQPAHQLLPEPFEPLHTWQAPSGEPIVQSPECREIELVTNTAWEYTADEIARRIARFDKGLAVEVSALPPKDEDDRRASGQYDISLLSLVYEPRPSAYYLWDNLRSTGWANDVPGDVQVAADLAAKEAKEGKTDEVYDEIEQLHSKLDAYLIPMGAPTRVMAKSDRLVGLDPGRWYLDPDDLRLTPTVSEFRIRSALLAAGVLLIALATVNHFLRKADDRRRRLELSLRMLRHDLMAPLSTIRANAERIQTREPKIGEALLSEADAALAVAEDARFVLQEGRAKDKGSASTWLQAEVVEPILGSLKRRSTYEVGHEPTVKLNLPEEPVTVAVPPEVAKFVARTLVENAWRHRGDSSFALELAGTVSDGSFYMDVKDHGPGMSAEEVKRLFRTDPGSDTESREYSQGSGVALHLAWSVLHLHGGEIKLRRAADPTIFTIRFPLAPEGRGKPDEPPEKETP